MHPPISMVVIKEDLRDPSAPTLTSMTRSIRSSISTAPYQYPAWATAVPADGIMDWSSVPPAFRPEDPMKAQRSVPEETPGLMVPKLTPSPLKKIGDVELSIWAWTLIFFTATVLVIGAVALGVVLYEKAKARFQHSHRRRRHLFSRNGRLVLNEHQWFTPRLVDRAEARQQLPLHDNVGPQRRPLPRPQQQAGDRDAREHIRWHGR